ncbi:prepilin-type N-terminal cleavage/methylation domain-containing protein [Kiritimatiellota bacterium B12222]|nr:prepilin-type N-terminal cleavage/methylation domain-containing protein [Kiritimatiellota bacterium B12222]
MNTSLRKKGFTLIEMLVVIAILALLSSIIVPAVSGALRRARAMACLSNLRSLGTATYSYAVDNQGEIPFVYTPGGEGLGFAEPPWFKLLAPYVAAEVRTNISLEEGTDKTFRCPEQEGDFAISYGPSSGAFMDGYRLNISDISAPAQKVWLLDVPPGKVYFFNPALPSVSWTDPRHRNKSHALFFDGHVSALTPEEIEDSRSSLFKPTR